MIRYLTRLTIRNLVSPYGLAMISYCGFLFAWFFPPDLYTEYVREPDLMFMDPQTLLFYTICVAAFLIGVRFSRLFGAFLPAASGPRVFARNPLPYLLVPLVVATLYCFISLLVLGGQINFVALLASQHGDAIKTAGQAGQLEQTWGRAMPALTSVLWWSLFRVTQLDLRGTAKTVFYLTFFAGTGMGILTCIATVDRTNLMPIILGLFVVHFLHNTRTSNANAAKLLLTGAFTASTVVGLFLLFSFLRGALVLRLLVTSLLGYSIVSYNRMAALLLGTMHYAYEGRGVYLSRYLLQDGKLNTILHLGSTFGWPDTFGLWQTEFSSTMAAGLNPGFIWSGAFGYIYSDIGWWTPLYLYFLGLLVGYLWSKFNAGKTAGLVLYPWMAFCILVWFSANFVFSTNFVQLCEFAFALHVYDKLFLRRARYQNGGNTQIDPSGLAIGFGTPGLTGGNL
jgi:hypothetical protein